MGLCSHRGELLARRVPTVDVLARLQAVDQRERGQPHARGVARVVAELEEATRHLLDADDQHGLAQACRHVLRGQPEGGAAAGARLLDPRHGDPEGAYGLGHARADTARSERVADEDLLDCRHGHLRALQRLVDGASGKRLGRRRRITPEGVDADAGDGHPVLGRGHAASGTPTTPLNVPPCVGHVLTSTATVLPIDTVTPSPSSGARNTAPSGSSCSHAIRYGDETTAPRGARCTRVWASTRARVRGVDGSRSDGQNVQAGRAGT